MDKRTTFFIVQDFYKTQFMHLRIGNITLDKVIRQNPGRSVDTKLSLSTDERNVSSSEYLADMKGFKHTSQKSTVREEKKNDTTSTLPYVAWYSTGSSGCPREPSRSCCLRCSGGIGKEIATYVPCYVTDIACGEMTSS
jgi:hypothetical protein